MSLSAGVSCPPSCAIGGVALSSLGEGRRRRRWQQRRWWYSVIFLGRTCVSACISIGADGEAESVRFDRSGGVIVCVGESVMRGYRASTRGSRVFTFRRRVCTRTNLELLVDELGRLRPRASGVSCLMQLLAPVSEYVPLSHTSHELAPELEYLPATHSMHSGALSFDHLPLSQAEHALLPVDECVPPSHAVQEAAPAFEYVPLPHAKHLNAPDSE